MFAVAEASKAPESRAQWLSSRWVQGSIVLVCLALLVRALLPIGLRHILIDQGDQYLRGQISLDDVDLSLFAGSLSLKGATLWPEGKRPEEGAAPRDPPLLAFDRFYVNISWLSLATQVIELEEVDLDGLRVNLARLQDRTLVRPDLRELPPSTNDDTEEADLASLPEIRINRATLRNARIDVRDDVPGRPTHRQIALPSLAVESLSLNDPDTATPGRIAINAGVGDGTIRIEAQVDQQGSSFDVTSQINVAHLPLDQLHVHEPSLGWESSRGRLDAGVSIHVDPEARVTLSGTASVSDLEIRVPGESDAALAWRTLAIDVEEVSIAEQRATVTKVSLDGAQVVVHPQDEPPLPILPRAQEDPVADEPAPPESSVDQPEAPTSEWSVAVAEVEITDAHTKADVEEAPVTAHAGRLVAKDIRAQGESAWAIGSVEMTDSSAGIELPPGPARLDVESLRVEGLSSDPAAPIQIAAKVSEDSSLVEIDASLVREPEEASVEIDVSGVKLGRYATLSGSSPVRLPSGTMKAALHAAGNGDEAKLGGTIAIDDAQIHTQDGEDDFAVAWESLAIDIRSLALSPNDLDVPMRLEVADFQLSRPQLRVTLTDEGIVLPTVRERATLAATAPAEAANDLPAPNEEPPTDQATNTPSEEPSDEADGEPPGIAAEAALAPRPEETAEAAEPQATEPPKDADRDAPLVTAEAPLPAPNPVLQEGLVARTEAVKVEELVEFAEPAIELPLGVAFDHLQISDGTLRLVDRSVRPTYRGSVTSFDFELRGFDLPYGATAALTSFDRMTVALDAPGEAPVRLNATRKEAGLDVDFQLDGVPLAQFNPYVQRAVGYSLLRGAATAETSFHWDEKRYEANTDLQLLALDVANERGETLFRDAFGISLTAALALLRDVSGNIGFGIPISGSRAEDVEVSFTSIVAQALTKAILGALTSPLKLLGAVVMSDDKVGDIQPNPVAFRAGSAEISDESEEQVERIGDVLAASPAVRLEFVGRTGAADVRALKEAAVLAEMEETSGLWGGVLNMVTGGTRNAIRSALQSGDTASLSEEDSATLDELVGEKTVTDADLTQLATERAATLRTHLIEDSGVADDQISVGAPEANRDETAPEVGVNLVSRSS